MLLWLTLLWVLHYMQIQSYVIPNSNNILIKYSTHYKIDERINEGDYEMIRQDNPIHSNVDNMENWFYELNKLVSKEYEWTTKKPIDWLQQSAPMMEMLPVPIKDTTQVPTIIMISKVSTKIKPKKHESRTRTSSDVQKYDYDYLVDEYYYESLYEAKFNNTYHAKKDSAETGIFMSLRQFVTSNCTENSYNFFKCLLVDYRDKRQSPKVLATRLWKILKIWFLVYLVVAVPFWCTKGWCCCCLFCKRFKPRRTIDEARRYLVLNPPGIIRTRHRETQYEPTEHERECHEEFEHLIRTI